MNSLAELNAMIDAWDLADDHRRIGTRPHTIGGALTADAVALEARKIGDSATEDPQTDAVAERKQIDALPSLTARRLAQLPRDARPLPTVTEYDQLLRYPHSWKGAP